MLAILRGLGVISAVLSLSMPILAQEACQQGEVAGTWDLYIAGGQVDGPWTGWDACQVQYREKEDLEGLVSLTKGVRSELPVAVCRFVTTVGSLDDW